MLACSIKQRDVLQGTVSKVVGEGEATVCIGVAVGMVGGGTWVVGRLFVVGAGAGAGAGAGVGVGPPIVNAGNPFESSPMENTASPNVSAKPSCLFASTACSACAMSAASVVAAAADGCS